MQIEWWGMQLEWIELSLETHFWYFQLARYDAELGPEMVKARVSCKLIATLLLHVWTTGNKSFNYDATISIRK